MKKGKVIPKNSLLRKLDGNGFLRLGGQPQHGLLEIEEKHPLINESSTWQMPFGRDGGKNISLLSKAKASGKIVSPMSRKETWCCSEMLR